MVFATVHTNTTVDSVDRIVDVFPPHQQAQVRVQLSFVLEGILSQKLVPKKGGGRALTQTTEPEELKKLLDSRGMPMTV